MSTPPDLGPLPRPFVPGDEHNPRDYFIADQMRAERQRCYMLGVAAERERCAKLCEEIHAGHIAEHGDYIGQTYAAVCATAIRSESRPSDPQVSEEPSVRWCEKCGEGVTSFCRGNSEKCCIFIGAKHRNSLLGNARATPSAPTKEGG